MYGTLYRSYDGVCLSVAIDPVRVVLRTIQTRQVRSKDVARWLSSTLSSLRAKTCEYTCPKMKFPYSLINITARQGFAIFLIPIGHELMRMPRKVNVKRRDEKRSR